MLRCSIVADEERTMTTIATDILRALDHRRALGGLTESARDLDGHAVRRLMRELCEQADGVRVTADAWVFPDGSELRT